MMSEIKTILDFQLDKLIDDNNFMYDVQDYTAVYTMTLKKCYDNNLKLWENIETGLDIDLENEVIDIFNKKYSSYEVGYTTWGEFINQIQADFLENCKMWNLKYNLLNEQYLKDPLFNQKFSTTNNIINNMTQTLNGYNINKRNDTPQGQITALNDGYLTELTDSTVNNENIGTNDTTATTEYLGVNDQEINLLNNYLNKIRNITTEIINYLRDNFMLLY